MSEKIVIESAKVPHLNKLLSQGIRFGNTLYLSGSLGTSAETNKLVTGGIEAETRQSLKNIGYLLEDNGFSFNDVVKTTVLLGDIKDTNKVNEVYAEFFKENPPARSCYQVGCLPRGAKIEIEAIAINNKFSSRL